MANKLYILHDSDISNGSSKTLSIGSTVGGDGDYVYVSKSYSSFDLRDSSGVFKTTIYILYEVKCRYSNKRWSLTPYIGISRTNYSEDYCKIGTNTISLSSIKKADSANISESQTTSVFKNLTAVTVNDGESYTLGRSTVYVDGLNGSHGDSKSYAVNVPGLTLDFAKRVGSLSIHYDKGDFTSSNAKDVNKEISLSEGYQVTMPSISRKQSTETKRYTIRWQDPYIGGQNYETDSSEAKFYVPYGNFSWSGRYEPDETYTFGAGTYNLEAQGSLMWGESTLAVSAKADYVPELKQIFGYSSTGAGNGWFTDNSLSEKVTKYTVIDSNTTFIANRTPVTYKLKFNLGINDDSYTGSKPSWDENGAPAYIYKTYGQDISVNSSEYYKGVPTRFGFKFVGWHPDKNISYKSSEILKNDMPYTDFFAKKLDSISNSSVITLYSIWEPITQYIEYKYYLGDGSSAQLKTGKVTYNINSASANVFAPQEFPDGKSANETNWAFWGWADYTDDQTEKIAEWKSTKGVYRNPTLIENTTIPFEVNIRQIKEWTEGYVSNTIYGFWTISGKFVKINDKWKKVIVAYRKQANEKGLVEWVPLVSNKKEENYTSFSVYIDGQWRKEVH